LEEIAPPSDAYRKNVTVGTAAVAAARTCMDRLKSRGLWLTQRQRARCRNALLQADAGVPSPRFCGLDAPLADEILGHYASDNEVFARAAWGATWNEVFGAPEHDVVSNEIARDDETAPGHASYRALLGRVWPEVLAIAEDPDLSEPEPWKTDRRQEHP
jgi:hypothetical protein